MFTTRKRMSGWIALPAHHEPLARIEFVKGGAHRGDPALIAQVEFHAYSVTQGERLHYLTLRTLSATTASRSCEVRLCGAWGAWVPPAPQQTLERALSGPRQVL